MAETQEQTRERLRSEAALLKEKQEWAAARGAVGCLYSEKKLMRAAARAAKEGRHGDAMDLREEAEIVAHRG